MTIYAPYPARCVQQAKNGRHHCLNLNASQTTLTHPNGHLDTFIQHHYHHHDGTVHWDYTVLTAAPPFTREFDISPGAGRDKSSKFYLAFLFLLLFIIFMYDNVSGNTFIMFGCTILD